MVRSSFRRRLCSIFNACLTFYIRSLQFLHSSLPPATAGARVPGSVTPPPVCASAPPPLRAAASLPVVGSP